MSMLAFIKDLSGIVEKRVSDFLRKYNPPYIYVEFSGGKDSAVVLKSVDNVTDKYIITYIQIVGQTHYDNVKAVYRLIETLNNKPVKRKIIAKRKYDVTRQYKIDTFPIFYHIIAFNHSNGLDYWSAMKKYGFPAPLERFGTGKRWCCAEFKNKWLDERPFIYRGDRKVRYVAVGIRKNESYFRDKKWNSFVREFKNTSGVIDIALAPIIDFADADVIALLKEYDIYDIVIEQYKKWKRAPNCMFCPLMSLKEFRIAIENNPSLAVKLEEILLQIKDKYHETTFSYKRIKRLLEIINESKKLQPR